MYGFVRGLFNAVWRFPNRPDAPYGIGMSTRSAISFTSPMVVC